MTRIYLIQEENKPNLLLHFFDGTLVGIEDKFKKIHADEFYKEILSINKAIRQTEKVILFLPNNFISQKIGPRKKIICNAVSNPIIYFYHCPEHQLRINALTDRSWIKRAEFNKNGNHTVHYLNMPFKLHSIDSKSSDIPNYLMKLLQTDKNANRQSAEIGNINNFSKKEMLRQGKRSKLFYLLFFLCVIGIIFSVVYSLFYRSNFNWKIAVGLFSFIVLMAIASAVVNLVDKDNRARLGMNQDQNRTPNLTINQFNKNDRKVLSTNKQQAAQINNNKLRY